MQKSQSWRWRQGPERGQHSASHQSWEMAVDKSFGLGVLSSNDGVLSTKWEWATIQWSASLAARARSVRSRGLIVEASETRLWI